jgi:hypothetical protein
MKGTNKYNLPIATRIALQLLSPFTSDPRFDNSSAAELLVRRMEPHSTVHYIQTSSVICGLAIVDGGSALIRIIFRLFTYLHTELSPS